MPLQPSPPRVCPSRAAFSTSSGFSLAREQLVDRIIGTRRSLPILQDLAARLSTPRPGDTQEMPDGVLDVVGVHLS